LIVVGLTFIPFLILVGKVVGRGPELGVREGVLVPPLVEAGKDKDGEKKYGGRGCDDQDDLARFHCDARFNTAKKVYPKHAAWLSQRPLMQQPVDGHSP
jgi:hypothetical protein